MASYTPHIAGLFAEGVTIGAYPALGWGAHVTSPSGSPLGTATNTQVVTNQTVTFTGLTAGVRYYAARNDAATRYVQFHVGQDTVGGAVTGAEIEDQTITTADLADGAVTAAKAGAGLAVTNADNAFSAGQTISHANGLILSGAGGKDTLAISNTGADTGLTIGADITLYRVSASIGAMDAYLRLLGGAGTRTGGDTVDRIFLNPNGTIELGSGTATRDITIQRTATNTVSLGADDKLFVGGELEVDGALNHDGTTVGLYGVVPVVRAGAIAAPTGGAIIDAESRTAINAIRVALTNVGITS